MKLNKKRTDSASFICCARLEKRIEEQGARKGFVILNFGKIKDPSYSDDLLVYKDKSTPSGFVINFCPFCGVKRTSKDSDGWSSSFNSYRYKEVKK